ncbi:MAG: tripartite tricarboxylate transporter substrate binding protein [Burkholderiaceae bacterium]|nr:tripartite tricarboxylate transporter substrate binding protein [Burkholderiaceae bacterium]
MSNGNLSRRAVMSALSAAMLGSSTAFAQQGYPNRQVRMIMPWPAGGGGDIQTRLITQRLAENIGQPVVVENRAGANGIIGTKAAIAAAPDGYTLVFAVNGTLTLGPALYKDVGVNAETDLMPVSGLSAQRIFLAVPTNSPLRTIRDLVDAGKASDKVSYGSSGNGALSHICGAQLANITGAKFTHVPYKSASHAVQAMLAGDLQFAFLIGGDLATQVKAGRLRALAVTGEPRAALMPDVPTMKEAGVSGWLPDMVWFAVFAPAATPPALVDIMHRQIARVLGEPAIKERLNTQFLADPWPIGSKELGNIVRSEKANFQAAITAARITVD